MPKSLKRAFTLVELLVVVAIIALLTGIVLTNLTGSRGKSRDAKRISDLGQIQLALELYYDRCKEYPSALDTTTTNGSNPSGARNGCPDGVALSSYISKIPTAQDNPFSTNDSYNYGRTNIDYVLHVELEYYNELIKDGRYPGAYGITACDNGATPESDRDYCLGPK